MTRIGLSRKTRHLCEKIRGGSESDSPDGSSASVAIQAPSIRETIPLTESNETYQCECNGFIGTLGFTEEGLIFYTDSPRVVYSVTWNSIECKQSTKLNYLSIKIMDCFKLSFIFPEYETPPAFSLIQSKITKMNDPLETRTVQQEGNTVNVDEDAVVIQIMSRVPQPVVPVPAKAQLEFDETFPISKERMLKLLFSNQSKFFQHLHSTHDFNCKYQDWKQSDNCLFRDVTFSTVRFRTVHIEQQHRLFINENRTVILEVKCEYSGLTPVGTFETTLIHLVSEGAKPNTTNIKIHFVSDISGYLKIKSTKIKREIESDCQEYCSRFKNRLKTAILVGFDKDTGVIAQVEMLKPRFTQLGENVDAQVGSLQGIFNALVVLRFLIFAQSLLLVLLIFF